jgi:DNA-binding MarR family transcriptional regulator
MVADQFTEHLGDEDYQTQAAFRSAVRRFIHSSEEYARAAGIPPQQYFLLLMVRGHPAYPAVTIRVLADQLQIRPHSASLLVDRAVRRGLLARSPVAGDRRKVAVSLTEEGAHLLEQIVRATRGELRRLDVLFRDLQRSLLHAFPEAARDEQWAAAAQALLEGAPGEPRA